MTSPTPPTLMNRKELLEFAALDAFGLLDEYEASQYTQSFHFAPAPVQDEIRELQAQLVTDEALLMCSAEPPASLRRKVLDAVAATFEREAVQFAPLASIGRSRMASLDNPSRMRSIGATHFWRAAAFVLAGMVVVMAYFSSTAYQKLYDISSAAIRVQTDRDLQELVGPGLLDFLNNTNCIERPLYAQSGQRGSGVIYINEKTGDVFVLGLGVQQAAGPFTLSVTLDDGERHDLSTFEGNGGVLGVRIDKVAPALLAAASWEITNAAGVAVLRTA